MSVLVILAVLALIFCVLSIMGKVPTWVAVLLLCLIALVQVGWAPR